MVGYHFLFNLYWFNLIGEWFTHPLISFMARCVAGTFLLLVGVSVHLSSQFLSPEEFAAKNTRRGAVILGLGLILTAISWLAFPSQTIWFGILHLIGVSLLLSPWWLKLKGYSIPVTLVLFGGGAWLMTRSWNFSWLLPFGFMPEAFQSLDYFPLLPWLGLVLLGSALGRYLYLEAGRRRFELPDFGSNPSLKVLQMIGRNSLAIYVLHQPILWLVVWMFAAVKGWLF